jgi:nitroreductase
MNLDEAIQNHVAIKRFDSAHKMTKKAREKLLATVSLFPPSFKIHNWDFVVVDDPERRKQLRRATWNQAQVTDASILIILCTHLQAWRDESLHCWHHSHEPLESVIMPARYDRFGDLDPMQRDEAMRSGGIVAQTLMLSAQTLGYDSCLMDGFDADSVADLINLPYDHAICMFIAIGKSLERIPAATDEHATEKPIITDSFSEV